MKTPAIILTALLATPLAAVAAYEAQSPPYSVDQALADQGLAAPPTTQVDLGPQTPTPVPGTIEQALAYQGLGAPPAEPFSELEREPATDDRTIELALADQGLGTPPSEA